jgi:hypothetical protein
MPLFCCSVCVTNDVSIAILQSHPIWITNWLPHHVVPHYEHPKVDNKPHWLCLSTCLTHHQTHGHLPILVAIHHPNVVGVSNVVAWPPIHPIAKERNGLLTSVIIMRTHHSTRWEKPNTLHARSWGTPHTSPSLSGQEIFHPQSMAKPLTSKAFETSLGTY